MRDIHKYLRKVMKITQIREKDGVEALSVLDFNLLIEKIKTEIKTRLRGAAVYGI